MVKQSPFTETSSCSPDDPIQAFARSMTPVRRIGRSPLSAAALAQIVAAVAALTVARAGAGILSPPVLLGLALAVQIAVALLISRYARLPVWWQWIAVLFPVAVCLTLSVPGLPAWPFGLAFLVLALLFSNTAKERVPLYLSNRKTAEALIALMEEKGGRRFLDIGSGLGGVVRAVDGNGRSASGVETAPLVWAVSAFMSKLSGRGRILRQDLWKTDLSQEDVVYAFLSPEPMEALWEKARQEMKPGSLLVSNSFAVPGVEPDEVWEIGDSRSTRLLIYAINGDRGQTRGDGSD
jgi:hypothetical protein